jgi:hypothetical protein
MSNRVPSVSPLGTSSWWSSTRQPPAWVPVIHSIDPSSHNNADIPSSQSNSFEKKRRGHSSNNGMSLESCRYVCCPSLLTQDIKRGSSRNRRAIHRRFVFPHLSLLGRSHSFSRWCFSDISLLSWPLLSASLRPLRCWLMSTQRSKVKMDLLYQLRIRQRHLFLKLPA